MRKTLFIGLASALMMTPGHASSAQLQPAAVRQPHDSADAQQVVAFRTRPAATVPDSGAAGSGRRFAIAAISGTLLGSVVGLGIELHEHPAPNCDMCGVNSTQRDDALRNGALVGAVVGGVVAWYLFGRK